MCKAHKPDQDDRKIVTKKDGDDGGDGNDGEEMVANSAPAMIHLNEKVACVPLEEKDHLQYRECADYILILLINKNNNNNNNNNYN